MARQTLPFGTGSLNGRWMVPRFRQVARFDWDVAPIPTPDGRPATCWSGSVGLGINAKSQRGADAFRLVAFLAGPRGQALMTRSGLQLPNQRALAATPVYTQPGQRPAHPEVFVDAALHSRPGPWTDTPNTFWHDVYWTFIGKVFRGETSAATLLPSLVPLVDNALAENNEANR